MRLIVLLLCLLPVACSTSKTLQEPTVQATLWVQNAAEYEALTRQVYASAIRNLSLAKEDSYWSAIPGKESDAVTKLPPAIIMDVDETVLDNSPFQARMIKSGKSYNTADWNAWVNEKKAAAVPGAAEFARYADEQGIQIFYITNRSHDVEDATRENLISEGFPVSGSMDNILTKDERSNWTSGKVNRRQFISRNFRVIMLFGDDLNDFVPAKNISRDQRSNLTAEYSEYFGKKWFILPNPVYGSWEQALIDFRGDLSEREKQERLEKLLDSKN